MQDLIDRLEQEIKAARNAQDIPALLATANAAIDQLEAAASDLPASEQPRLLNLAKRIAYNSAADIWPGWEIDTPKRSAAELESALAMAEKCKTLTDGLDQTPMQRGNAIWLIGAFELALGRYAQAIAQFSSAASTFAGETEMALMAQGYRAIASECAGAGDVSDFDTVTEKLAAMASEDAQETRQQLLTARQIFIGAS